jgi:pimeloyl-ACP methyl ester carboxylesterase
VSVVLLHGAATTSGVWSAVRARLGDLVVTAPERPATGDLAAECAAVAGWCEGAVVAGVSGGATLGLALAASGVPIAGAVLHEPAAGSLAPGLLDPFREAWRSGGTEAFARALYGPAWRADLAPPDPAAVGRDLAMFAAFEPARLPDPQRVLLTVGGRSSPQRQASVAALHRALGAPVHRVPGAGHAVHLEQPAAFAALIRAAARRD